MDVEKIEILIEKLKEAELVLVGVGEELELPQDADISPLMHKTLIEQQKLKGVTENLEAYKRLKEIIENKNYFVVSLCTDGLIEKVGLKEDRVVEPCGSINRMQCSDKCTADIYESCDEAIQNPTCPKCGKPLVFNNIYAENYAEEGYLDKWQTYMKWLQGTVNRNTCIIELGVGMRFPSVIRWPFEKIAFFNQKATFFRVHSKLYQTTEEIKEKSYGIQAVPAEFLKELYNRL